jgi:hypothetical protein
MKKAMMFFGFMIFYFVGLFSQEPQPPIFENISVDCSLTYDCPEESLCYYTYHYFNFEKTIAGNTASVGMFVIGVNDFERDVILPQPIDFNYETVAASYYPYHIYYFNSKYPERTGIHPEGQRIGVDVNDVASFAPGGTAAIPADIQSQKPPTIKILWFYPKLRSIYDYITALCNYRGIDTMEFSDEEETQIELSYIRKVPSLGPSPAFIGSFDHWDLFISDVSKSKDLGWVTDNQSV